MSGRWRDQAVLLLTCDPYRILNTFYGRFSETNISLGELARFSTSSFYACQRQCDWREAVTGVTGFFRKFWFEVILVVVLAFWSSILVLVVLMSFGLESQTIPSLTSVAVTGVTGFFTNYWSVVILV